MMTGLGFRGSAWAHLYSAFGEGSGTIESITLRIILCLISDGRQSKLAIDFSTTGGDGDLGTGEACDELGGVNGSVEQFRDSDEAEPLSVRWRLR
jgi:hypothetical protein